MVADNKNVQIPQNPHKSVASLLREGREWKPSRLGEVLVDADGKIIGEVHEAIGTGYNAHVNGAHIGTYYTDAQAKRAIERAA